MKKIKNYHIFIRSNYCLTQFPLRILKFKKQKWVPLIFQLKRALKPLIWKKKKLKRAKIFQMTFKNLSFTYVPRGRWLKLKRTYLNETVTKRLLYIYYQKAITLKALKKETHRVKHVFKGQLETALLAKPFYRVDVLLYFLNFFYSVFQAKQAGARHKLLINSNLVKNIIFLKTGNLLTIKSNPSTNRLLVSVLRKHKSKKKKFLSFLEVDYYSKSIIIVQDILTLSNNDLALLLENKIRVKSFLHVF